MDIARGQVFIHKNIRALFCIAYVLLGYFLFTLIAPYIVRLFVAGKLPTDFHIDILGIFTAHLNYLLAGLAVLFIAFAFRKGYTLQNEQDLTV